MIASDHGFRWKAGRPGRLASAAAATAGRWHREEGIYLLWGPEIKADSNRGHGEVGQVASTLLALLGLPPGDGVSGPPLPGVEAVHAELADYRAHYKPAPEVQGNEEANAAEVEKLRCLGISGRQRRGGQGAAPAGAAPDPHRRLLQQRGAPPARARGDGGRRRLVREGPRGRSPERLGDVEPERSAPLPAPRPRPLRRPPAALARRRPARGGRLRRRPHCGLRPRRRAGAGPEAARAGPRRQAPGHPVSTCSAAATAWSATSARRPWTTSRPRPARIRKTPSPSPPSGSPASASATAREPPPASTARSRSIPISPRSGGRWGRSGGRDIHAGCSVLPFESSPSIPLPEGEGGPFGGRVMLNRRAFPLHEVERDRG